METQRSFWLRLHLSTLILAVLTFGVLMGLNMSTQTNFRLWVYSEFDLTRGFGFPFIARSAEAGTRTWYFQALYCDAVLQLGTLLVVIAFSESWGRKIRRLFKRPTPRIPPDHATTPRGSKLGVPSIGIGLACFIAAVLATTRCQNLLFFGMHAGEIGALTLFSAFLIAAGALLHGIRMTHFSPIFLLGLLAICAGACILPFYGFSLQDTYTFIEIHRDSVTQGDFIDAIEAIERALTMRVAPLLGVGALAMITGSIRLKPRSNSAAAPIAEAVDTHISR